MLSYDKGIGNAGQELGFCYCLPSMVYETLSHGLIQKRLCKSNVNERMELAGFGSLVLSFMSNTFDHISNSGTSTQPVHTWYEATKHTTKPTARHSLCCRSV